MATTILTQTHQRIFGLNPLITVDRTPISHHPYLFLPKQRLGVTSSCSRSASCCAESGRSAESISCATGSASARRESQRPRRKPQGLPKPTAAMARPKRERSCGGLGAVPRKTHIGKSSNSQVEKSCKWQLVRTCRPFQVGRQLLHVVCTWPKAQANELVCRAFTCGRANGWAMPMTNAIPTVMATESHRPSLEETTSEAQIGPNKSGGRWTENYMRQCAQLLTIWAGWNDPKCLPNCLQGLQYWLKEKIMTARRVSRTLEGVRVRRTLKFCIKLHIIIPHMVHQSQSVNVTEFLSLPKQSGRKVFHQNLKRIKTVWMFLPPHSTYSKVLKLRQLRPAWCTPPSTRIGSFPRHMV